MEAGGAFDGTGHGRAVPIGAIRVLAGVEAFPQLGDFIVAQSDVTAGDGSARKAGQHEVLAVAAELVAHLRHHAHEVVRRVVGIAPGILGDRVRRMIQKGHAEADRAFALRDAIADDALIRQPRGVADGREHDVAGVFDNDGIFLPTLPVLGKIQHTVDAALFISRQPVAHALAGRGCGVFDGGHVDAAGRAFPLRRIALGRHLPDFDGDAVW